MIRAALLVLSLAVAPAPAFAHKVIMGIFPSGSQIEGEIGFSNGEAPEGQLVEVFDDADNKLGETRTDADGFFLFTPKREVAHMFRANMGAGHVASAHMTAEEVAAVLAKADASTPGAGATIGWIDAAGEPETKVSPLTIAAPASHVQATATSLTETELDAIARAVRDETRPLRQELTAYKEKNDLQTILGGLGYIAGLFGLGFYIAARRKVKESV